MSVLDASVLVLNRSWIAVHIASLRRALSLVYQGLAHIVSTEDFGTYDFDSVMHYGQGAFDNCTSCNDSTPDCWTIEMKPGYTQYQSTIGQRDHFSDLDELSMQMVYPETNWVFVDRYYSGTENGTFLEPYNTFPEGAAAVPAGGTVVIQPGTMNGNGTYTKAMTLWAWMIGFAAFIVFLFAPVLGAIADFSSSKKKIFFIRHL